MKSATRKLHWSAVVSILVAFACLMMPLRSLAQATSTGKLTIDVAGARNAQGKLIIWLFKDARGFPGDTSKIFRQQTVDIDPKTMSAEVMMSDLPLGTYAVSVLHDENNNGKMDKNLVGIPREGYGASNNPSKKLRAANFDEAEFSLSASEQTVTIKLIY